MEAFWSLQSVFRERKAEIENFLFSLCVALETRGMNNVTVLTANDLLFKRPFCSCLY